MNDHLRGLRVLIVCWGKQLPLVTMGFVAELNRAQPLIAVGFFLPFIGTPVFEGVKVSASGDSPGADPGNLSVEFAAYCRRHDIPFELHTGDFSPPMPQVFLQSRYTDVFVAGADTFSFTEGGYSPVHFLKQIIRRAQCPVIIPASSGLPRTLVLKLRDRGIVEAMKQFSYLFPDLTGKLPVSVVDDSYGQHVDDYDQKLENFVRLKFSSIKRITSKEHIENDPGDACMFIKGSHGAGRIIPDKFRRDSVADIANPGNAVFYVPS